MVSVPWYRLAACLEVGCVRAEPKDIRNNPAAHKKVPTAGWREPQRPLSFLVPPLAVFWPVFLSGKMLHPEQNPFLSRTSLRLPNAVQLAGFRDHSSKLRRLMSGVPVEREV